MKERHLRAAALLGSGLTAAEVARELGVTPSCINKIVKRRLRAGDTETLEVFHRAKLKRTTVLMRAADAALKRVVASLDGYTVASGGRTAHVDCPPDTAARIFGQIWEALHAGQEGGR